MDWRDIRTAPRDGTVVIVGAAGHAGRESHWDGRVWSGCPYQPTHWQPMPSVPPADDDLCDISYEDHPEMERA